MKELLDERIESIVIADEVKKANEEKMNNVKNKDADEKNAKDEMERVGVNEELLKKAKLEAEVSQKRFIEMMKVSCSCSNPESALTHSPSIRD